MKKRRERRPPVWFPILIFTGMLLVVLIMIWLIGLDGADRVETER